mgnify:CR=1 FL=1
MRPADRVEPGSGDTAYVGMCELQVLDNDAPKYAKLDPRQYHGSAYGMVLFVLCIGFIIWYVINNFRENES